MHILSVAATHSIFFFPKEEFHVLTRPDGPFGPLLAKEEASEKYESRAVLTASGVCISMKRKAISEILSVRQTARHALDDTFFMLLLEASARMDV